VTNLYDLDVYIGMNPVGALVQATNGKFTNYVVGWRRLWHGFSVSPWDVRSPRCTSSRSRTATNLWGQWCRPAMGTSYGITVLNGPNGDGTVFEMTPSGTLTTLYAFNNSGLSIPVEGLMQGPMGTFTE